MRVGVEISPAFDDKNEERIVGLEYPGQEKISGERIQQYVYDKIHFASYFARKQS